MLMRGAVAAQFEGVFEPYFRAAYHHMWEEPKKMDDLEIFRSAFASSGIDIDRLIARAQQDDVKKKLIELTNRCRQPGRVRVADLLRRQGNVLRQGPASRRRGFDRRADRPGRHQGILRFAKRHRLSGACLFACEIV